MVTVFTCRLQNLLIRLEEEACVVMQLAAACGVQVETGCLNVPGS